MNWTTLLNSVVDLTALLFALLGIVVAVIVHDYEKRWRYFYIAFFSVMVLKTAAYFINRFLILYSNNLPLQTVFNYINLLFSSAIIPLMALYLLLCCREKLRKNSLWRLIMILWGAFIVTFIIDLFINCFVHTTAVKDLSGKRYFVPVYLVITAVGMAAILVALIRRKNQLSKFRIAVVSSYLFAPVSAMVFVTILLLFVDFGKRYAEQKEELARQKSSLAVLQMRPHFIYNTMTSIYYLIKQDSVKAQHVTLNFTEYLRKNFTAIAKEGLIPFSEELEHTRAYLAVEQVRFEEKLFVNFDTPFTSFKLPPLTLQPIVENAVKYGINPELKPLYINIQTRETASGIEITVSDNGPGFNSKNDNKPHTALTNIAQRIKSMCKGTLNISAAEDGGTVVKIFIPAH